MKVYVKYMKVYVKYYLFVKYMKENFYRPENFWPVLLFVNVFDK